MTIDERRLALIRFVSREYNGLFGLFDMAFAVILASGSAWTLAFGFSWWSFPLGFAAAAAAWHQSTNYYWRRFGRVRSCLESKPQTWRLRLARLFGLSVAAGAILDEKLQGAGTPSLFFLVLSAPILWRVMSTWPFQAHWALVSLAGLVGSALFVTVDRAESQEQWMATSLSFISIALFIAGWLDHRLVVRALSGGASSNEGSELNEPVVR